MLRYGRASNASAQVFGNFSNSGKTFLLRDGNPIVDQSRVLVGQAQHGFGFGKETLIYGVDYMFTDARTNGTINGSNESDDTIKELGGYVHSVTKLTDKIDFVAALRADKHSRLPSAVWSPRVALVLKPNENNNIRFTYNRSFSTPSNNNLFLEFHPHAKSILVDSHHAPDPPALERGVSVIDSFVIDG